MNRLFFLFAALLFNGMAWAQLLKVSAGTDLTILSGTIFHADGLTLTPSANFTISNNTLNKFTTITHPSSNPYISRVYRFTNTTSAFTGSVQINYRDGAELNGIAEKELIC